MRSLKLGLYVPNALTDHPRIEQLEAALVAPFDIVSVYFAWQRGLDAAIFEELRTILAANRTPLVTWEPWRGPVAAGDQPANDPAFSLARILAGEFDAYIQGWLSELATLPGRVYLRPLHEMNGNWYPWCGTTNGNDADDYVLVWRHLRSLADRVGVRNVTWVWSPYVVSVPDTDANALEAYYPGDDYVDWVGLDGYNWGLSQSWSQWQEFDEIFGAAYRRVVALTRRPVMLAELGASETGGSKAGWISRTFAGIALRYPRIEAVVWFDVDKECDWRIDSSPASLDAFRSAVAALRTTADSTTGVFTRHLVAPHRP